MGDVIKTLSRKYPQALMPIRKGIQKTEEYKDVVLRGEPCPYSSTYITNPLDSLETVHTIAGDIEVLSLIEREDFKHAVQCLGNRCEPEEIPDSTGAMAIFGLNNWDKVRANEENYKDNLIILSSGPYSGCDYEMCNRCTNNEYHFDEVSWMKHSISIRKYHELTHFIMRKKFPEDILAIRDEIIADTFGLIATFHKLDVRLLKLFLGVENKEYRQGGRLQNYGSGATKMIPEVIKMIEKYEAIAKECFDFDSAVNSIRKFMQR